MLEIFLWKGKFLFKGNAFTGSYHRHIPIQIIVSFKEDITVSAAGGPDAAANALAVASNVEHVCRNHGSSVSLFVDPETNEGKALVRVLSADPITPLPIKRFDHMREFFESFTSSEKSDISQARKLADSMLEPLLGEGRGGPETDSRIKKILDLMPSIPEKKISVGDLASSVGLSETRLMHLFKEEVGIPVRRYLLWKRLIDAIHLIKRGQPLTMAALEAGFADYAHFSRTFKGMFGARVEDVFKNDRFVQAYVCET